MKLNLIGVTNSNFLYSSSEKLKELHFLLSYSFVLSFSFELNNYKCSPIGTAAIKAKSSTAVSAKYFI